MLEQERDAMTAALLVVDVRNTFSPPNRLMDQHPAPDDDVCTVEHYDESEVPFRKQLGWSPDATSDRLWIPAGPWVSGFGGITLVVS
jgi:hypothetical protein